MDKNRNRRSTSAIAAAMLAALMLAASARAQQAPPIVLYTSTEQIPLKAYAELMKTGVLKVTSGSTRDIPTVTDVSHFRCGLTGWEPKGVLVASEEFFRTPRNAACCRS